MLKSKHALPLFIGALLSTTALAEDVTTDVGTFTKEAATAAFPTKPPYSPYAERNFPTRPLFGDTHTHTSYSMDAGDAHTALAAVEEDNFMGKTTASEPSPVRATHPFVKTEKATIMGWEQTASGYAAVWATENTREAIFDAMKRRETYATTGPRMVVRFFGGWDFESGDASNRLPAKIGYTKGVPMGGDLSDAPKGKSPTFLVAALKDPIGANLDRIQIIKGWVGKDGSVQERIYDVAVSGGRSIGPDGRARASVGNTVDVANASWTNTIGAGEMITVWKDPDFDPALRAFYYARVIEIPTPRWTAYDAKYYGIAMPKEVPMTTTERAYTSPMWYTP